MTSYLIFDTETTGLRNHILSKEQPFITEFCGCILDTATGGESWHEWLVKPPISIPNEVTSITGIDDALVKECPSFCEVAEDVRHIVEGADSLVAHNLAFDLDMLRFEFDRCGEPLVFPAHRICTVEASLHIKGRRLSLADLHEHLFGEPHKEAHRARPDVEALVRVFKAFDLGEDE